MKKVYLRWSLRLVDCIISFFLVGPLVVIYWRSVWIFPDTWRYPFNASELDIDSEEIIDHSYEPYKLRKTFSDHNQKINSIEKDNRSLNTVLTINNKTDVTFINHISHLFHALLKKGLLDSRGNRSHYDWSLHKTHKHAQMQLRLSIGFFVLGSIVSICSVIAQYKLQTVLTKLSLTLTSNKYNQNAFCKIFFTIYAYILSTMAIIQWRGFWNMLNLLVGTSLKSASCVFLVGFLVLMTTGTLNNVITVPLNISNDWSPDDLYIIPTIFQFKPIDSKAMFVLDGLISVLIFNNAVTCLWNGGWNLFQGFSVLLGVPSSYWLTLYFASITLPIILFVKILIYVPSPFLNDSKKFSIFHKTCFKCCPKDKRKNKSQNHSNIELEDEDEIHTFCTETPMIKRKLLAGKIKYPLIIGNYILRYTMLVFGFIGVLTYWIGLWLLLDYYIHFRYLALTHFGSFLALTVFMTSNSIIFRGVYKDNQYFSQFGRANIQFCGFLQPINGKTLLTKPLKKQIIYTVPQRSNDITTSPHQNMTLNDNENRDQTTKIIIHDNHWLIPKFLLGIPWIQQRIYD